MDVQCGNKFLLFDCGILIKVDYNLHPTITRVYV